MIKGPSKPIMTTIIYKINVKSQEIGINMLFPLKHVLSSTLNEVLSNWKVLSVHEVVDNCLIF